MGENEEMEVVGTEEQPTDDLLRRWVENSRYKRRKEFRSLEGYFTVIERLGEGTFSEVFKAVRHKDKSLVALKQLNRTTRSKQVYNESRILERLKGEENVALLLGGHAGTEDCRHVQHSLIFPLYQQDDFRHLLKTVDISDVRRYMYSLCNALANIHKHNIIHRDVKPSNFLFSRATGMGYLIDFGLAHEWKRAQYIGFQAVEHGKDTKGSTLDSSAPWLHEKCTEAPDNEAHALPAELGKGLSTEKGETSLKRKEDEMALTAPNLHIYMDHGSETNPSSGRRSSTCLEELKPLSELRWLRPRWGGKGQTSAKHLAEAEHSDHVLGAEHLRVEPDSNAAGVSRAEPSLVKPGTPSRGPSAAGPRPCPSGRLGDDQIQTTVRNLVRTENPRRTTRNPVKRLPHQVSLQQQRSRRIAARTPDANRGGTPGFRAPEVLLRAMQQGPGIDIWAAGVVFASLLTGRYPLFSGGSDDCSALLELCIVFGAEQLEQVACSLKKRTTLCKLFQTGRIRTNTSSTHATSGGKEKLSHTIKKLNCENSRNLKNRDIPEDAFDLLGMLLEPCPNQRISASEALKHPFFSGMQPPPRSISGPSNTRQIPVDNGKDTKEVGGDSPAGALRPNGYERKAIETKLPWSVHAEPDIGMGDNKHAVKPERQPTTKSRVLHERSNGIPQDHPNEDILVHQMRTRSHSRELSGKKGEVDKSGRNAKRMRFLR